MTKARPRHQHLLDEHMISLKALICQGPDCPTQARLAAILQPAAYPSLVQIVVIVFLALRPFVQIVAAV